MGKNTEAQLSNLSKDAQPVGSVVESQMQALRWQSTCF